jgi:hypothetical protein
MPTTRRTCGSATLIAVTGKRATTSDASAGTKEGKAPSPLPETMPPLTQAPRLVIASALVVRPDTSPLQVLEAKTPQRSRETLWVLIRQDSRREQQLAE